MTKKRWITLAGILAYRQPHHSASFDNEQSRALPFNVRDRACPAVAPQYQEVSPGYQHVSLQYPLVSPLENTIFARSARQRQGRLTLLKFPRVPRNKGWGGEAMERARKRLNKNKKGSPSLKHRSQEILSISSR
jgi:hypothetical protein